ncbi:MerR family transcriptional regulator [Corynebacterium hindlerae]|uniref:MerR family transcriptional regulator n=1 Tax=Corynebacterium hindlerae TaxID=699041 RepID=UPI003AAE9CCA
MRIKELADTAGTTVRTVRYYHEAGLLPTPSGTPRDYTFEHLVRLIRIRNLVSSGLSLEQVKKLIGRGRVDPTEELRQTKQSIDERISQLLEQRRRIEALEQRQNQNPTAIPLPKRVTNFYRSLLERESDPTMRRVIKREQRMVEVLSHLGLLDSLDHLWDDNPSEEYLDVARRMFHSFYHITELTPDQAEEEIDQLLDEHLRKSGFDRKDVPKILEKFLSMPRALDLIYLAYPHPNHKMYVNKFISTYLQRPS